MKNWMFAFGFLICLVSCKSTQDVDNQKDSKMFDLSKYSSVLYENKVFTPELCIKLIDSIQELHDELSSKKLDFYAKFRTLDSNTIVRAFQDSTKYYQRGGSFSFHFNSLIFQNVNYCGIAIDRIEYLGWLTHCNTFLLVYKKGKIIDICKIAQGTRTMEGTLIENSDRMRSKVLNDTSLLVETIIWRFQEKKKINQIDTLSQLVTFGFSEKLRTDTLYFATKPFKKIHFEKEKNPKTGVMETKYYLFFKDK